MIEVEVNGETLKASYSVWALSLYEQEFGGANMLEDLFGVQEFEKPAGGKGEGRTEEGGGDSFRLDFGANDWATLMRALWAGAKNEDDSLPSFKEWAKSAVDFNIFEIAGSVPAEVMRVCF